MDDINWKDVEEALNNESPQKKDLIKEVVKLKKQRSDFVDFVGWIMNQTQYAKFNSGLNDKFLSDLDNKIDEIFKVVTE